MKQKRVEILAPAGSLESMKAAVAAGADAVYIGGSRFGARAYADNPEEDRLLEAIDYAHLHGCRLYMTVNTLMKETELADLYAFLEPYYMRGVDAVIVQDMGAFALIRERFPDLPVHASTQMTITGVYGARILKELGAERVVTARELSLEEIAGIHREVDVEIESFVHGALCYCYSGQCLFSSLIGGRSGNRGRCAQTCRLPYDVKRDGKTLNGKDSRYVLSLKDLCTLDLIPDMIEAGIYSMKIEGRMKSPRYTAGVVEIYRRYTDLYLERGRAGYRVDEKDRKRLLELFDRGGQTDGYYRRHNGKDMVVWKEKPSFREGNQELFDYLDKNFVEKQQQEPIRGTVVLETGKPALLELSCGDCRVSVSGDPVLEALKQPMDEARIRKQLEKTGNTPFYFETLTVELAGEVFLPVQSLNDLRRRGLEALEDAVLKQYRREAPQAVETVPQMVETVPQSVETVLQTVETADEKNRGTVETANRRENGLARIFVSLERPDCLSAVLDNPHVKRVYVDAAEFGPELWKTTVSACHDAGKECMLTMPHIFRTEAERYFERSQKAFCEAGFDGVLIRSMEEIGYLKEHGPEIPWVFDYGMYGMNDRAESFLMKMGAAELTWPVELNERELSRLSKPGELIAYGRLPMMVTAQCIHQGTEKCDKKPGLLMLKDRMAKEFPVKNHCAFCYNTIYNAAPVSLLGMEKQIRALAPAAVRLQFTVETPQETAAVIRCFTDSLLSGKRVEQPFGDFTRGHFKRGVE